jgi:sortase A
MTHRDTNSILTIFVVILGSIILLAPFLPQLDYLINGPSKVPVPSYALAYEDTISEKDSDSSQNRLFIPVIGLEAEVQESPDISVLNNGLWHRPQTPTPPEGGNTVIVGHRFSYNPAINSAFYFLDKVSVGDVIYLKWKKTTFKYTIREIKVVDANQVQVENNTPNDQLTLYTCTPLWNPIDRLVVVADKVGEKNE